MGSRVGGLGDIPSPPPKSTAPRLPTTLMWPSTHGVPAPIGWGDNSSVTVPCAPHKQRQGDGGGARRGLLGWGGTRTPRGGRCPPLTGPGHRGGWPTVGGGTVGTATEGTLGTVTGVGGRGHHGGAPGGGDGDGGERGGVGAGSWDTGVGGRGPGDGDGGGVGDEDGHGVFRDIMGWVGDDRDLEDGHGGTGTQRVVTRGQGLWLGTPAGARRGVPAAMAAVPSRVSPSLHSGTRRGCR